MKLLELKLNHFKGIKEFTFSPNGKNVGVYGDNATGKTTLFDAMNWLLFGKDSLNRTDFGIKTIDKNGDEISKIEHSVVGTFDVDGTPVELNRQYKEIWSKKRGCATESFSGHTTEYLIDGVPQSEKEYMAYVNSLIDSDVFKLITNPLYFNEIMNWQDRRQLLLNICGDVTDDDVIQSSKKLTTLTDIINGKSIDEHKKKITARKTVINKELTMIPERIDELYKLIPDTVEDISSIDEELTAINEKMEHCRKRKSLIENGQCNIDDIAKIELINEKIKALESGFGADSEEQKSRVRADIEINEKNLNDTENTYKDYKEYLYEANSKIAATTKKMDELRDTFKELNSKAFDGEIIDICPTCEQALPTEKVEEAKANALANFNKELAIKKEEINAKGKALKEKLVNYQEQADRFNAKLDDLDKTYQLLLANKKVLASNLNAIKETANNPKESDKYKALLEDKHALEQHIEKTKGNRASMIANFDEELANLSAEYTAVNTKKANFDSIEKTKKRILELEENQKKLSAEYENIEQETFLIEDFIKAKVELLNEKINKKFKLATFKMFESQVNGGLKECCEVMYNNIPYKALNNAARLNVGLDIINTLTKHYNVTAPLFIDNAEAVTTFIDSDSQIIKLIVTEGVKALEVKGA